VHHLSQLTRLKLRIILGFALVLLCSLTLSKFILFFIISRGYFSDVSLGQFALGILNGLRFDTATVCLFFMPAQLLLLLPYNSKTYLKFFFTLDLLLALAAVLFASGDIIFFGTFTKHLTVEAPTALANLDFLIPFVLREYWYALAAVVIACAAAVRLGFRYITRNPAFSGTAPRWRESLCVILAVSALGFLGIREKLTLRGKFLKVMDADVFGSQKVADLTLNGIFSSYEAMRQFRNKPLLLDAKTAAENAAGWVLTKNETPADPEFPFLRRRSRSYLKLRQPNVVVILLESWDKHFMAGHLAAAPNFRELWENGLRYTNFYAAGTRSLLGLTGTMFSIPYIPGLPHVNGGLEAKNFPRLADYFKHLDYKTYFIQADRRSSEKADEIAAYMDFDKFYGAEDNPYLKDPLPVYKKNDYEAYELLFDKLDSAGGKFMCFFYTATTHYPYNEVLPEKYKLYPGNTEEERYLNLIHYSDAGLGAFLEKARKRPWFDNTVFLILPDHRAPFRNKPWREKDPADAIFSTFLAVYGPKFFKPALKQEYASQQDVLPTLLDIAGSTEVYASAGGSLFDPARRDKVILYGEDGEAYIVGKDLRRQVRLAGLKPSPGMDPLDFTVLALDETLYRTLKDDHWMKRR
jgi:phosphoglycerol transferase MdoB-like AlkP superfamily enzyme